MLTKARRLFDELPAAMRAGLALAAVGVVIDLVHHLGAAGHGTGHGPVAFVGHSVALVGMIVTMLGLVGAAFTRRSASATQPQKGETR